MAVTLMTLCDSVDTTMDTVEGLKVHLSYDELKESLDASDLPALQVYPDSFDPDVRNQAERTTFRAGVQNQELVIFIDHFDRVRSHIGLDMKAAVKGADAIIDVLEAQGITAGESPFGNSSIKAFNWSWQRRTLLYGNKKFVGGRFTLRLRIF
jgi:hypothetical protein